MKKILSGLIFGSASYFLAGVAIWMVFPWHNAVIKKLPEETLIRDTLKVVVKDPGFYLFPSDKTDRGRMPLPQYADHFRRGPVGIVIFAPKGKEPMGPKNFIVGFFVSLGTAGFCLWILTMLRGVVRSVTGRVLTVLLIGVFVWFNTHIPYWNWFFFPLAYVWVVLLDSLVCFGVLGLVLAKFVPERV